MEGKIKHELRDAEKLGSITATKWIDFLLILRADVCARRCLDSGDLVRVFVKCVRVEDSMQCTLSRAPFVGLPR